MFNILNRFLVYITVGAVAGLIGMGWWLNITIDQKAILKQAVATQEHTITTLQNDVVDREWVISENAKIQKDIVTHMINTTNEITELKRENPNKCYTQLIPTPVLERLHWGDESGVYQTPDESITTP